MRIARSVTPSFALLERPVGLRVPSGNVPSTRPSSRTRFASRNASVSAAPRRMPNAPFALRNGPATGQSIASCFAIQWTARPSAGVSHDAMSGGSALLRWLLAMMSGPSFGSPSSARHVDPREALEEGPPEEQRPAS